MTDLSMSELDPYRDENGGVDEEDDDDAPKLDIATSKWRRRRPWWKSCLMCAILLVVITAIIIAVSHDRPQTTSSSSSDLATQPPQQQQNQQQQNQGSSATQVPQRTRSPAAVATHVPQPGGAATHVPQPVRPPTRPPTSPPAALPTQVSKPGGFPTTSPVAASSPSASPDSICVQKHFQTCQTERLSQSTPLTAGSALCFQQYQFGVTAWGILQWYDCVEKKVRVVTRNNNTAYFSLSPEGAFRLFDKNDELLWQKNSTLEISSTTACFGKLDCPFLFIRMDGVLILKALESSTGQVLGHNVETIYQKFYQN